MNSRQDELERCQDRNCGSSSTGLNADESLTGWLSGIGASHEFNLSWLSAAKVSQHTRDKGEDRTKVGSRNRDA